MPLNKHQNRLLSLVIGVSLGIAFISGALPARAVAKSATLRVALLPILDALPYHVAHARGFFQKSRTDIIVVPVANPVERDQLMQSGHIDGMLTELTTTAYFNRDAVRLKIVTVARSPVGGASLFRILAAPGSDITAPAELAGVPIGISINTVIEYITDRLLTAKGVLPTQIVKRSVPVIPERYQLLIQGQLPAATLPEPLANSAMAAGAQVVVADRDFAFYSMSVLSFTREALETKPEAVKTFLQGWDRAVGEINRAPDSFREILLGRIRVPPNIRDTYPVPRFPRRQIPTAAQWADVMDWMVAKDLVDRALPYGDSVTTAFLPRDE
jgi:NitT/TauT family transport system substrate-binding protein